MHTILLVDDEAIIAAELEDRLSAKGYKILGIATSGAKAVAMAGQLKPDLVIMDIIMPGMDGVATVERLQENEFTRNIPVIMLSAGTKELDMMRGLLTGPVEFIDKPIDPQKLLGKIEYHLKKQEER